MQGWTLHNFARCALVFAEGPLILFEFHNCEHLHEGIKLEQQVLISGRGCHALSLSRYPWQEDWL